MTKTLYQRVRPFIPDLPLRIRHVEPHKELKVRLRQHLGLVARGAKRYEEAYVRVLRALMSEADIVFDVGANIGFYTVLFSGWVGLKGKVLAFEPDSSNLQLLRQNVSANDGQNVVIRECALAEAAGHRTFSIDTATGSTGYLGRGPTYGETMFGDGHESLVTVQTSTLDSEAKLYGPPALIKVDIEGGEYDMLLGGTSTLREHRPLVVSELGAWSDEVSLVRPRAELATQLLSDFGYSLWNLDTGSRVCAGETAWMILAVPQERIGEVRISDVLRRLEGPPA